VGSLCLAGVTGVKRLSTSNSDDESQWVVHQRLSPWRLDLDADKGTLRVEYTFKGAQFGSEGGPGAIGEARCSFVITGCTGSVASGAVVLDTSLGDKVRLEYTTSRKLRYAGQFQCGTDIRFYDLQGFAVAPVSFRSAGEYPRVYEASGVGTCFDASPGKAPSRRPDRGPGPPETGPVKPGGGREVFFKPQGKLDAECGAGDAESCRAVGVLLLQAGKKAAALPYFEKSCAAENARACAQLEYERSGKKPF
jgi:hypothetical protein